MARVDATLTDTRSASRFLNPRRSALNYFLNGSYLCGFAALREIFLAFFLRLYGPRLERNLSGCNLPGEVVTLVQNGTSTGRRLARTVPPDSPTEGLSPSNSVPAGRRY